MAEIVDTHTIWVSSHINNAYLYVFHVAIPHSEVEVLWQRFPWFGTRQRSKKWVPWPRTECHFFFIPGFAENDFVFSQHKES